MKILMLSEVLTSLNKHKIPYGLQTYSGGTVNVWIGANWERKAQTNLVCDDMQMVAAWLHENALALFPQLSADENSRRRA